MAGPEPRGAYGFRLYAADPEFALPGLSPVAGDLPAVRLEWSHGCPLGTAYGVEPGHYLMSKRGGGSIQVEHATMTITCVLALEPSHDAIVHPLLTMPMSFFATWQGNATLHGGAFVHDGRAWIVCGGTTSGKSTTFALLAARGVPVLSDDLAVIEQRQVWAGPRCVDLRPDVAARMPAAYSIGTVAGGERFRLPTVEAPPRAPLGGIVVLGWHDGPVSLEAVEDLGEKLAILHGNHYAVRLGPLAPEHAMDLLDVPMWRLRRARDWEQADAAVDQLLALDAR